MMPFWIVLILCLACALYCIHKATWLATTRGNTISDIVKSGNFKDLDVQVKVTNLVSFRSNYPIAALWLIALGLAIGLPAYMWSTFPRHLILTGDINTPDNFDMGILAHYHVRLAESPFDKNGQVHIPVFYSPVPQTFTIEPDPDQSDYTSFTLQVTLAPTKNAFIITEKDTANREASSTYRATVNMTAEDAVLDRRIEFSPVKAGPPEIPRTNDVTPQPDVQDSSKFPDLEHRQ
jgi:hypothetical protein